MSRRAGRPIVPPWVSRLDSTHQEWNEQRVAIIRNDIRRQEQELRRLRRLRTELLRGGPISAPVPKGRRYKTTIQLRRSRDLISCPTIYEEGGTSFLNFYTGDIFIRCIQTGFCSEMNFGKYSVMINLEHGSVSVAPYQDNTYAGSHFHPHVSADGTACLGTYVDEEGGETSMPLFLRKLLAYRDYDRIVQVILSYLRLYNPGSPYQPLGMFDGEYLDPGACEECRRAECECTYCEVCSARLDGAEEVPRCPGYRYICLSCCTTAHIHCDNCSGFRRTNWLKSYVRRRLGYTEEQFKSIVEADYPCPGDGSGSCTLTDYLKSEYALQRAVG